MSPTLTTFLFEAANFLVLATILGWFFFKPVRQTLADRRDKLTAQAADVEQKLADAAKKLHDVETAQANLQKDLDSQRTAAINETRTQADQILAKARQKSEQELNANKERISRLSESQQRNLAEASARTAAAAVRALFQTMNLPDFESALIESACRQLKSLPQDGLAPITVESNRDLSEHEREQLLNALGPAANTARFRTKPELVTGVRIATGRGLVDASVAGLTQFASAKLTEEVHRTGNNHHSF